MKILHFILILLLVAAPSGAIWLYLDSQRETEHAGLFGDIKPEVATARIPPIFWEDPISVEEKTNAPAATLEILSDDAAERIKKEIFSDILEAPEEPESVILPAESTLEIDEE